MFVLFIIWKSFDFLISFTAPRFIPYLGFFPYREFLVDYNLPTFLSSFASFDGTQYLTLVREGYNTYTQAYFPLYFLTVRLVSELFPMFHAARIHNDLLASLVLSNVSFLLGLYLFQKYLALLFPKNKSIILWTTLFLLFFPTSFFFGAVYTEGLFFLLFFGSLYFLQKKNYWITSLFAVFASTTRFIGIFLTIPFLFHFIDWNLIGRWGVKIKSLKFKFNYLTIATPLIGLCGYMVYLWKTVGDPLFFFNAQPAFGANRSTHFILLPQVYYRYIKILFTAQWNFQYFISLTEVLFFTFIFVVLILDLIKNLLVPQSFNKAGKLRIKNFDLIALNFFSFVNLILPTLTGTFSSIPRYALFSISAFIFLGGIKNIKLKIVLLSIFLILHTILLGFFIQGYFVG